MLLNCGVGEDSWESLGQQGDPASPTKGNQSWIFTGRTDAETPVFSPPDARSLVIGKDPDAGKGWRWEEKGTTEDEMVGWHHQIDGHEFEQAPGVGDGQGCLVCCRPWGCKESARLSDWTQLNWVVCYKLYERKMGTVFFYWLELISDMWCMQWIVEQTQVCQGLIQIQIQL